MSSLEFKRVSIARDIRNTFRIWRRNPGSTLSAYLALTLGIGATTTIFSVLSSLLLSPLPVADAGRLVRIAGVDRNNASIQLSMPDALDLKQRLQSAAGFAFFRSTLGNLSGRSRPAIAHVLETDADLFRVMGVRMSTGRGFRPEANQPGHNCEVVLSWPFWKSHFGGLAVDGQTIRLDEEPCVIDGVLPKDLDLPVAADLWAPLSFDLHRLANGRSIRSLYGLARLKRGAGVPALNAELAALSSGLASENPAEDSGMRIQGVPLRDWLTGGVKASILILFAAVVGVLLMACVNVANLLLARTAARMREISVRIAVGASRQMLFQQLLTESMILALASAFSGLVLTAFSVRLLRALPDIQIPRPGSITVDWRVMAFAVLAGCVTAIIFGTLPAFRTSMTPLAATLKQAGGRATESRRQQLVRKLLVASETAIATVLLIASLLLLRSFGEVSKIDPGFRTGHLLTAYVSLPQERYGRDTVFAARFAGEVVRQLRNAPGIEAAAFTTNIPLQSSQAGGPVQLEGQPMPEHEADSPFVLNTDVTSSYRKTLDIPLLAGRDLQDLDDRDGAPAVLVNAAFAKLFFQQDNPVGKRLRYSSNVDPNAQWQEIVGVIGDTRQEGLEGAPQPELYMPLSRFTTLFPAVVIRTADNPASHLRDIENAVRQVDADVPIFLPRTMEQVQSHRLGLRMFNTALLSGFAAAALLLAGGGVFAVIAYSVSQRTSEIGVRIACGASHRDIICMIVREGALPALIGVGVGIPSAFVLTRYLEGLLYGVQPTDIASYASTVVLLGSLAALASLLPAQRAARIDSWRALSYE